VSHELSFGYCNCNKQKNDNDNDKNTNTFVYPPFRTSEKIQMRWLLTVGLWYVHCKPHCLLVVPKQFVFVSFPLFSSLFLSFLFLSFPFLSLLVCCHAATPALQQCSHVFHHHCDARTNMHICPLIDSVET